MYEYLGITGAVLFFATMISNHFLPPPKPVMVGVDLGTTYSCVGVFQPGSGEVHILRDDAGKQTIPSIVGYVNERTVYTGHSAERQIKTNPHRTIYDAKRFIGKNFTQAELDKLQELYSFKLTSVNNQPYFYIKFDNGEERKLRPEDIGAEILKELKKTAEVRVDTGINMGVMSVPADFDMDQRNYTAKAGELAGLKIKRIISEPTAAAMAYGLHKRDDSAYIMVVDIGGGTSDVSVLFTNGPMFATVALAGNNRLGGQDFNEVLYNYLLDRARTEFYVDQGHLTDIDHQILRETCEDIKLKLSVQQEMLVDITLQQSTRPVNIVLTITRRIFEHINRDLFDKVLEPIEATLKYAELQKSDISDIVLVGGSTRIPRIRELISEYFNGKELNTSVDPELAVCTGVALQAGIESHSWPLQVAALEVKTGVKKISL
ncbi:hypothetical protein ACHWQZ_G013151 [Mnemiopsis leidyi]